MKKLFLTFAALALLTSSAFAQSAALPANAKLYRAFERFVSEAYLQEWFASPETVERHYAPRMANYWGKRGVRQSRVLRDKLAYADRWPERDFRLVPGSLIVRPGPDGMYDISFNYEYDVRSGARRSAGVGETSLRVLLEDPRVVIFSESGRVLRRF